jgi:ABC-2 type transport system ATP-binding protein
MTLTAPRAPAERRGERVDHAIEVRGLRKSYGARRALDGLDLSLPYGRVIGLLGENGCGKTTLLKVLAGVLADYEGHVRIDGEVPGPASKARVSFLPDISFLPDGARTSYCIDLYDDFFEDFRPEQARELIGFFGIEESMRLKQMSKGMREKVQIALAMARDARVHLLDEPISGVDPAARDVILQGVLRNLSEDSLLLVSTHLIHDLEPILDGVVLMRGGRVVLAGEVDELRAEHGMSIDQLFREVHR